MQNYARIRASITFGVAPRALGDFALPPTLFDTIARTVAKRVFYNRRYKMPTWLQPYTVWAVVAVLTLAIVFFTSVERIPNTPAASLPTESNAFAEGLYYELSEAEPGEKSGIIRRYAERLAKKHGYTLSPYSRAHCSVLGITRGKGVKWFVAAALQTHHDGIFAVLVFLDRLAATIPDAAVSTALLFPAKGCSMQQALHDLQHEHSFLVFVNDDDNTLPVDRIPNLRNLHLRRHFPSVFFMPERTHWANVLAITSEETVPGMVTLPVKATKGGLKPLLLANPLLQHPAVSKLEPQEITEPVALYLGAYTQLHRGGFFVILALLWLLALIPLVNALGIFRERMDLSSALTSAVLYALAFGSYLLLLKLSLNFFQSDLAVAALVVILVPVVFFPLRILQKTMLRAELNRPGLHVLLQFALTIALFVAPVSGAVGLWQLTAASAYARADWGRKLLRLLAVLLPLVFLAALAREPMGGVHNFLSAYLPFSSASWFRCVLLCFVGGNLTALLFVPRERD